MAVPLLAIFAAGLGLQELQQRFRSRARADASELEKIRLLEMSGTARNLEQISPQHGMILQAAVETSTSAQFQSMLRAFQTEHRAAKEFAVTSGETAATGRANREDKAARLEIFQREKAISLNPELREQFAIIDNLNVRQVTDSVTGEKQTVPTRVSPIYKTGVDDLRQKTEEARKINELVDLVTTEGLQRDASAPITTLMRQRYNEVVAFTIADLGFGVPQAAEFLRVEQGLPDPTAFWTKVRRGEAATIAPLMQILEAKQRDLGNIVRDQRNWNVDQLDTTRALNEITNAANIIPSANARIGEITQTLGGAQTSGGESTVATAQAQVLAARANLLFNPEDPSAQQRLRQSQEFAKRLGEDPDASIVFPDVLPEPLRGLSGSAQSIFELISTFARKGR